jgi:hypothetical protein
MGLTLWRKGVGRRFFDSGNGVSRLWRWSIRLVAIWRAQCSKAWSTILNSIHTHTHIFSYYFSDDVINARSSVHSFYLSTAVTLV